MMDQSWKRASGLLAVGMVATPLSCVGWAHAGGLEPIETTSAVDVARLDARLNDQWIEIPGTETVIRLWDERSAMGELVPHYAISLDGRTFATSRATSYDVMLRRGSFDPLKRTPEIPSDLEATAEHDVYLVQFVTQPLDAYRSALTGLGATVHKFVSQHSYVVQMNDETREKVAALPYVRWVGDFHPAYKVDDPIRWQLLSDEYAGAAAAPEANSATGRHADAKPVLAADRPVATDAVTYNIVVFERGPRQKQIVANRIRQVGGRVDNLIPDGFRMVATLDAGQLLSVLRMSEVGWVDLWSPPETDMNVARQIGGADFLETNENMTGQGVRGEVMDNGIRGSHVDFQDPPILYHGGSSFNYHGTNTFGITFGTGTGQVIGRGMLPDAEAKIFALWSPPNRYQHTEELVDPDGTYRGLFQTNSWGSGRTRSYDPISQEMDDIIFHHDVIITQSQSNAGNQDSRPQAWAKNIVSVGGVYHQGTLTKDDDSWNRGASIGPASDGRIKPDLTHFYDWIYTAHADCDTCYTSQFGGTSGATPIVAGHFGLLFQMWHEGVFPGFGGGKSVFDSRPHYTTAKALIINSSEQYEFSGSGHDLTRTHQGWGMPQLEYLHEVANDLLIVNESEVLSNLESRVYNVTVDGSLPEFRATLVYNDPPGTPFSNPHRINDLSLKVTSPSNTVYWGNNGLLSANYSSPGGSANTIDTVENVLIQNPEVGEWTVEVIASEIVEDAHLETGTTDADFALVVSGGVGEPGMLLEVPDLIGGQNATFTVTNATPGQNVYYIYSLVGQGSTFVPALNVTLDLQNPQLGGSAVADGGGTAEFTTLIPDVGPRLIWLQAAEIGSKTNLVATQIN